MALLDLQGLEPPKGTVYHGSGASKGCFNGGSGGHGGGTSSITCSSARRLRMDSTSTFG